MIKSENIYRYMYKDQKIIIEKFNGYFNDVTNTYYINLAYYQKPIVKKENLSKLKENNYIMYDLDDKKQDYFINLIIEKKKSIIENHQEKIKTLKKEIKILEGKK